MYNIVTQTPADNGNAKSKAITARVLANHSIDEAAVTCDCPAIVPAALP